jgi:hypothetical protein
MKKQIATLLLLLFTTSHSHNCKEIGKSIENYLDYYIDSLSNKRIEYPIILKAEIIGKIKYNDYETMPIGWHEHYALLLRVDTVFIGNRIKDTIEIIPGIKTANSYSIDSFNLKSKWIFMLEKTNDIIRRELKYPDNLFLGLNCGQPYYQITNDNKRLFEIFEKIQKLNSKLVK